MKIRKAVWSDLDPIMEIYQQARQLMVAQGTRVSGVRIIRLVR
ncbi:hypothetical protein [Streptococcus danieliae]